MQLWTDMLENLQHSTFELQAQGDDGAKVFLTCSLSVET